MNCDKCKREVHPTRHKMGEYEVDFYGKYDLRSQPTEIVCKDCYVEACKIGQ